MKLSQPIFDNGCWLEEVNPCDSGVYFIFKVPQVQRGIKGKNKARVDELLIVGVPWNKVEAFAAKYGIKICRKDEDK